MLNLVFKMCQFTFKDQAGKDVGFILYAIDNENMGTITNIRPLSECPKLLRRMADMSENFVVNNN